MQKLGCGGSHAKSGANTSNLFRSPARRARDGEPSLQRHLYSYPVADCQEPFCLTRGRHIPLNFAIAGRAVDACTAEATGTVRFRSRIDIAGIP